MKDNNKKKKDIKKTLATIVMAVAVILIITVIALLLYKNNTKSDGNSIADEKSISTQKAKELFNNSYLVAYLLEGDVKIGEGKLVDEQRHLTYYAVDDENLKDFKSTEDIMKMIYNSFVEDRAAAYARLFYGFDNSQYNVYTSLNNTLYVLKTDNICKSLPSSIDLDNLKVTMVDDTAVFSLDNSEIRAYKNIKENRWDLSSVSYTCSLYDFDNNSNNQESTNNEQK